MSNPARELLTVLSRWRSAMYEDRTTSPSSALKIQTVAGAADVRLVYRLIGSIEAVLDRLAADGYDVDLYRRDFRQWSMLPITIDWTTVTKRESFIPRATLDKIEYLAHFLDGKVPEYDEASRVALANMIREVRTEIESDESLPQELRRYILRLISDIETALSDHKIGFTFDFVDAATRLWTALGAAAYRTDDNTKRGFFADIFSKMGTAVAASAVGGVAGALTRGAIGQ